MVLLPLPGTLTYFLMTSVLIPDGESTLAKHVVHCLAVEKNITIHILSKDPNASIKHSKHIKSFHVYDLASISTPDFKSTGDKVLDELIQFHHYDETKSTALIDQIIECIANTKAEILFPVDEHIVKVLSAHKDRFEGVVKLAPMADYQTFTTAIDKWKLAVFDKANNIPHPITVKYQDIITGSGDHVKFPVIIKPVDQGNAQGIRSFKTREELDRFFGNADIKHDYIIQPFVNGYDIDCSVLCSEGKIIAHTIQKGIAWSSNNYAAAVGIEFVHNQEVLDVVTKLMSLLNFSGVAHLDLRYDEDVKEIKVIEINARYWGSLLGSLNAGVNFPLISCLFTKGEVVEPTAFKPIRYFMGKAPLKQLITNIFSTKKDKIRLRDTSFHYTLRDPLPAIAEVINRVKIKLGYA